MALRCFTLLLLVGACHTMNPTTSGSATQPAAVTSTGGTDFTVQIADSQGNPHRPELAVGGAYVPPVPGATGSYSILATGQSTGYPIHTMGQSTGYQGQTGQSTGYQGQTGQSTGYQTQTGQSTGYQGQTGQSNGYQTQTGQNTGYQTQTGQSTGYQGQTGQNTGYQTQTGQSTGYQGQTGQSASYQGQTTGQNTGFQNQATAQNTGFQNQGAAQNTGFQNQATAQNNGFLNQGAAQTTAHRNQAWPVSHNPTPNNQINMQSGQNQMSQQSGYNGLAQNLVSQSSGNTGNVFQGYPNSLNGLSAKPSFGVNGGNAAFGNNWATGGNGVNGITPASSLTNTIGGQGSISKNPQALNSIVQKFFKNFAFTSSVGGLDAVERSRKMLALTSRDISHRFMYNYPSYGLLQDLQSYPQSYNAAKMYIFKMAQAESMSDIAAQYAVAQALVDPNPVVKLMAQIDAASGKFGQSELARNGIKMSLYSTYKAPGALLLRS